MTRNAGSREASPEAVEERVATQSARPYFGPGARVASYELVRCIGRGGGGVVYEARHTSLRRRVALKTLSLPVSVDGGIPAGRAGRRFLREGRAAAQVRHPHVVDVYDLGVDGGVAYLVMELVDGESLAQLLRREIRLDAKRSVDL